MEFVCPPYDEENDNIWVAASNCNINAVKYYLENSHGSLGPNSKDDFGYTPMHAASSYGGVDLLAFLVSCGGDINVRDNDGDTPLLYCEDIATLEFLVSQGADIQDTNSSGESLFSKMLEDENEDMINYLVAKGIGKLPEHTPQFSFSYQDVNENDEEQLEAINEEHEMNDN